MEFQFSYGLCEYKNYVCKIPEPFKCGRGFNCHIDFIQFVLICPTSFFKNVYISNKFSSFIHIYNIELRHYFFFQVFSSTGYSKPQISESSNPWNGSKKWENLYHFKFFMLMWLLLLGRFQMKKSTISILELLESISRTSK